MQVQKLSAFPRPALLALGVLMPSLIVVTTEKRFTMLGVWLKAISLLPFSLEHYKQRCDLCFREAV